jgi:hypothetical protein
MKTLFRISQSLGKQYRINGTATLSDGAAG